MIRRNTSRAAIAVAITAVGVSVSPCAAQSPAHGFGAYPSQGQYVSSQGQYAPAQGQHAPAQDQYTPPQGQYAQQGQAYPSQGQYAAQGAYPAQSQPAPQGQYAPQQSQLSQQVPYAPQGAYQQQAGGYARPNSAPQQQAYAAQPPMNQQPAAVQPGATQQANRFAAPQGPASQGPASQGHAPQGYGQPNYAPQAYGSQGYAPQGYGQAAAPVRVAQTPTPGELPAPPAAEEAPEIQPSTGYTPPAANYHAAPPVQAAPTQQYGASSVASYSPARGPGDCNGPGCTQGPASANQWESYAGGGCATGDCATGGYGCDTGCYDGSCGYQSCDLGVGADCGPSRQWFFGLYGITLERLDVDRYPVAFAVDDYTGLGANYFPQATDTHLYSDQADTGMQWGAETRFGFTFGSACDPCGGVVYQPFAFEVGYWAIAEETDDAALTDTTAEGAGNNYRIRNYINYGGIEYDDGGGARDYNDYVGYGMPLTEDDVQTVGVRVRESFSAQNLELNFWRFGCPAPCGGLGGGLSGCGVGSCGVGGGCDTGCDTGCYQSCPTDCCETECCPKQFFISGLAGVRYLQLDNNLQYDYQYVYDASGEAYTGFPAGDPQVLSHIIDTENQLVGFQLGSSMNWVVGCKLNLFADTNFGVYNNRISYHQWLPNATYETGGGAVRVDVSDDQLAFVGEARLGAGYQVGCNCRLTSAFRLIAVSGVAMAAEQVKSGAYNAEYLSQLDTTESLVLYGYQTGVEWKY
ncbi:hypothetical protein Mal64_15120 [Pseudobythopirellula maris]|uniref:Uncharacterized protein n=1 Tax=Pseudobythopirellula maris TaxID=2527991 RepID=A0A5C5ZXV6_9BACT|nr:BBP7 family outer membrane beta-barrel protein [Pseudobythopirellula maris]TWT91113.1 hypothetical protein Mal64_15120 [Pseudobythopirellula maris]